MASTTYSSWVALLDEKEHLSDRLLDLLKEEITALIANDIDVIKKISDRKSGLLQEFAQIQIKITDQKNKSVTELKLNKDDGLRSIFGKLEAPESRVLQRKREHLERLARRISKSNDLNRRCLASYLDQVKLSRAVFSTFLSPDPTYNAYGQRNGDQRGGRLLNRSF